MMHVFIVEELYMPSRNVPEDASYFSDNTQNELFKKYGYLADASKSLTNLIHEYNESMIHFNHVLHALKNNQLDRDALSQSLATKIEKAKQFLREYSKICNLPALCFETHFKDMDYHLGRLKKIPLNVNPLVVFQNVRKQFDQIRAFINESSSDAKSDANPSRNYDADIAVQYITNFRKVMTCGLDYFLANPYYPPQTLDDWLPRKTMSNTSR